MDYFTSSETKRRSKKKSKKIKVLSCAQLFAEVMYNVHHNESISSKFIM